MTTITVTHIIGRNDIGDSTGSDEDWQRTVCVACDEEIEKTLRRTYGDDADITVSVEIGSASSTRVDAGDAVSDDLRDLVRDAAQRGFDRACG